jgi:5-methylcytosine-specific restriction endonuclease McrBC regulatory subunit McrC
MDQFFEAWVELVMRKVAQNVSAILTSGRKRETVAPLTWDPPYLGSQQSLVPDVLLETKDFTIIVDAKYKRHWQELQSDWRQTATEIQEQHRADLLQVLAYANLARSNRVICCLMYPCTSAVWDSLGKSGRLFHRASLPHRGRVVELWLTAVPMGVEASKVATPFVEQVRHMRTVNTALS